MSKFSDLDFAYMVKALKLAGRAAGKTKPNPMVGALIVAKNGKVIGSGFHIRAGMPHAEISALNSVKNVDKKLLKGATMYVTLEPCCHTDKRTPPCVIKLIESGIDEIFIAQKDPNPKVSGKGIRILEKAGIKVILGLLEKEASLLNVVFIKNMTTSLPFVATKVGISLDGKYALNNGKSKWITNAESRDFVHNLRSQFDAIITTSNTVIADNPNMGTHGKQVKQPLRVVIDRSLRTSPSSDIYRDSNVVVYTISKNSTLIKKFEASRIKVIVLKNKNFVLNVLKNLYELGICDALFECGGTFNSYLLKNGFLERVYLIYGNKIIGDGKDVFGQFSLKDLSKAPSLNNIKFEKFGDNFCLIGDIKK